MGWLMAILVLEKDTLGIPQLINLVVDFARWSITTTLGKVIAILIACLFAYQQIRVFKACTEKKDAIKTVAKNVVTVIGRTICIGVLITFGAIYIGMMLLGFMIYLFGT